MKIYDFDLIKDTIPISRYLADRGIEVRNGRFAAVWRDSNDLNISISRDDKTFCDHARGQAGGSVIDLCMLVESIQLPIFAASTLGDRYHLESKNKTRAVAPNDGTKPSRYIELLNQGYERTAVYTYTDEAGNKLYDVYRMTHPGTGDKTFLQRSPDHWGLENTRRVLYNLPAVIKASTVYIVEGEKDANTLIAHGLCATTNNSGAKNWDSDFNRFFQGKNVVVLCDNDAPGVEHAKEVLRQINDTAAAIKVLSPSKLEKGDVTDYLTKEGGTIEALLEMIANQPLWDRQAASAENAQYTVEEARSLNAEPFRNYFESEEYDTKGRVKVVKKPIPAINLVHELRRRFLNFPQRIVETLFDCDLHTGKIVYFKTPDELFSWISMKSKRNIEWASIEGAISQAQFFQAVRQSVRAYDGIAKAPHYPLRPEIFYVGKPLPTLDPSAPSRLDELVDRFSPASTIYRVLIKALFMAPMFSGGAAPRPAWVIDSVDGKGVGKTTLVKILADLYSEAPIDIDAKDIKTEFTSVMKRLISSEGRSRRIALLDNVQGTFKSPNLARLITSTTLSGIAPYGRGEETRLNDLTYVLTSNAASLDDDIAQRCYTIKLRRSDRKVSWESETRTLINSYRETIYAEIIAALSKPNIRIEESATRYPEFESTVLCAACKNIEEYNAVIACIKEDNDSSNATTDRAQETVDVFREAIDSVLRISPGSARNYPTFLNTSAISHIITSSETLRIERISKAEISEMIQSGNIKEFSKKVNRIRRRDNTRPRGWLWLDGFEMKPNREEYINIIEVEKDALVFRATERHEFKEV